MKGFITVIMLMISTVSFGQVYTSIYGNTSVTTIVGRHSAHTYVGEISESGISNRKYKKIVEEQKKRKEEREIEIQNFIEEVNAINDSISKFDNLLDSLRYAYMGQPNEVIKYKKDRMAIMEEIRPLWNRLYELINVYIVRCDDNTINILESEKQYEFLARYYDKFRNFFIGKLF